MPPTSKLLKEWETARDDLNLDIVSPYDLDLGNNTKIRAAILVRNFGGTKGTLIFTDEHTFWRYHEELAELGYGASVLDEPSGDPVYDRDVFIDMLSEWEWTGREDRRPHWLKVAPHDSDAA